jgi:gluconolactonase
MAANLRLPLSADFVSLLLGVWASSCAAGGQGQPASDAGEMDEATPFDHVEAGGSGSSGGGSSSASGVSSSGSGSGSDASGGSSSGGGTSGTPDSGRETGGAAEGGTAGWTCPAGPFGAPTASTPVKVAGMPPSDVFNNTLNNFTSLEGPVWIGGALYVSEYPGSPNPPPSRILKLDAAGAVSVAVADSGSNGLAVDKDGNLVGAVHEDGSISRFDLSTGMRVAPPIVSLYMGIRFNSPNDLAIRSDGTIYFSDPNFQAPSPAPQMATRAYGFSPGSSTLSVVDATLTQPNGVTLSLDEKTLYVSSSNGIQKYSVMADGSTGPGSPFAASPNATLNVDGMALDCAGNLYGAIVGGGNVVIFSPSGAQIGSLVSVTTTGAVVTNVAFGGSDHKTLYVTTQGSSGNQGLFKVPVSIPGMPY